MEVGLLLLLWQKGYGPPRASGGPGDLERQEDKKAPRVGARRGWSQYLDVAQTPAKALLVHRYPVVGAPDAQDVYTDGLDAAVVQIDGARGRRQIFKVQSLLLPASTTVGGA